MQFSDTSIFKNTQVINSLITFHVIIIVLVLLRTSTSDEIVKTFGLRPSSISSVFSIWQFVTYMFIHGDLLHLFINMLFLWLFGREVERTYGEKHFLFYYLMCGIMGGITFFLFNMGSVIPLVGSVGAVYGVMVAYAMYFPNERVVNILPIKSKYVVIFFALSPVIKLLFGPIPAEAFAPLGGMIAGFLYIRFGKKQPILHSQAG